MNYLNEQGLNTYDTLIKSYIRGVMSERTGGSYTPTLQSAPTSSTTTYTKDGKSVEFKVGDVCRVIDANTSTGYCFYQLYDLLSNNTVAVWQAVAVESKSASSNGTTLSLVTTGEKYTWQNKVSQVKVGTAEYDPTNGVVSLPAYPTSLPASDVYSWAKEENKPSYTLSEVGAAASVVALTENVNSTCSITGAGNAGKMETIVYTNSSGSSKTVTIPTTYSTPDGTAIVLTVPNGGYCEVNYLNINGTIYARGV